MRGRSSLKGWSEGQVKKIIFSVNDHLSMIEERTSLVPPLALESQVHVCQNYAGIVRQQISNPETDPNKDNSTQLAWEE